MLPNRLSDMQQFKYNSAYHSGLAHISAVTLLVCQSDSKQSNLVTKCLHHILHHHVTKPASTNQVYTHASTCMPSVPQHHSIIFLVSTAALRVTANQIRSSLHFNQWVSMKRSTAAVTVFL